MNGGELIASVINNTEDNVNENESHEDEERKITHSERKYAV